MTFTLVDLISSGFSLGFVLVLTFWGLSIPIRLLFRWVFGAGL